MNTHRVVLGIPYLASLVICSQSLFAADFTVVLDAGPHQRTVQSVSAGRDEDGNLTAATNTFVELRSGLNRWSEPEQTWVPASDVIEEINGTLIARQAQYRILFGSTADDGEGVVELLMMNGARFRVRPLGVAYSEVRDGTTARSLFVAEVNAASPTLTAPNQVTYPDALPGADLQYDLSLAGIEQNIVLRTPLPPPAEFQLDESAVRVEVWTEVLESPAPARATGSLVREDGSLDEDESLDFGPMRMGEGRAFALGERETATLRVAKVWHQVDGRTFLIESVPYTELAAWTDRLEVGQAREFDKERLKEAWAGHFAPPGTRRGLPIRGIAVPIRKVVSTSRTEKGPAARLAQNRLPSARRLAGVVLDWSLLSTVSNFTFRGDTTYYVSGPVTLSVTGNNKTIIEGGTVVKFTNSPTAQIVVTGPIDCETDAYRPAVFTSKDDDSVGEKITGSNGNPSGYYGSGLYVQGSTLRNLRISFAYTAVSLATAQTLTVQDSQFVRCLNAFLFYAQTTTTVENSLFYLVDAWATGGQQSSIVSGVNLTVHDCSTLSALGANSSVSLENSLLVALDSEGSPPVIKGSSVAFEEEGAPVFMTIGAGSHYLAPDSPHRDAGTTQIDANLLGRLRRKTTCPPVPLVSDFTANTVLGPRHLEDVGGIDRGYHYDVLDYIGTSLNVTNNSTLTLTNGVAVGGYGPRLLWLRGTSRLVSEGLPNRLNRLATFHAVQEQPLNLIANTASMTLIVGAGVTVRFSDVSFLAAATSGRNLFPGGPFNGTNSVQNSQLRGVYWSFYNYNNSGYTTPAIRLTNSVLERCRLEWTQGYAITPFQPYYLYVTLRNCLFSRSTVNLGHYGYYYGGWDPYDNLFDGCSVTLTEYDPYNQSGAGGSLTTVGYNGYLATTGSLGGSGNKTITTRDFLTGLLGGYYYPTSGGNLSQLINAGSRTATAAGLSTFTTAVNNAVDSGTVDIGFHYLATDPNVVVTIAKSTPASNAVEPSDAMGSGRINGRFTVTRTGATASSLNVYYLVSGTAINGTDYTSLTGVTTIPQGNTDQFIDLVPAYDNLLELPESAALTLLMTNTYSVGPASKASEIITDVQPVVFQTVASGLDRPVGIDYNATINSLIVSVHWDDGLPNNFISINSSGTVNSWSTLSGMPNEIKLAAVRASGSGFTLGDQYFGTGVDRKIGKLLANGTSPNLNWVTLSDPTETRVHSLHIDTTGVFGGDLIAVTGNGDTGGGVWRVTTNGTATSVGNDLNTHLEGVLTVPNDVAKYGPWAGRILAGSEDESRIYAIDVNGAAQPFQVAVSPGSSDFIEVEDIDLIPADQDLYCVDAGIDGQNNGRVWKVSRSTFANFVGDFLVTQEGDTGNGPRLFILRWDGCDFVAREFTDPGVIQFEHVAFAPVSIPAQ